MIKNKETTPVTMQQSYMNFLYAGVVIAALALLGWHGLRMFRAHQGKKLQVVLSESLQEFQTTMNSYVPQWGEVQEMNELGASQAAGTALQPYFVVMQAQALAQQQKYEDAVVQMEHAITLLPSDSLYKDYYMLTKHLMQLDVPAQKEAGLAALKALSDDVHYPYRDAALYHVGEYYSAMNDDAQAKQAWQQLAELAAAFAKSPWVALAQQKLATL